MKRVSLVVILLAVGACTDPAPDTPGDTPPGACDGLAPVDLDAFFAEHLDASRPTGCSANGCHGTGAGGLAFTNAHELWAATVNKPSVMAAGRKLVVPGDPASSELLTRIGPDAPNRMPMGGPYLDDAARRALAAWVCAGAPEPARPPDPPAPDGGAPSELVITDVTPTSGLVGTQVVLTGTGFDPDPARDEVRFGEALATVSSAAATRLVVTVPEGATSGPVRVTVGGRTATSLEPFRVIAPNPVPVATSMTPASFIAGSPDTAFAVEGSSFIAASTVLWDGEALVTTFVSDTRLAALVPASRLERAGTHAVIVVSPGPGGGPTAALLATVENPAPAISAVTPGSVPVDSAAVTLVVEGTGIVADTRLLFDGTPAPATLAAPGRLELVLSGAVLSTAATHSILLENPSPGGGSSASASFTVANPAPTLASISPAALSVGSGDVPVIVTGAGFVAASSLLVDGSPLFVFSRLPTELRATLPSVFTAAAGTRLVQVVTPGPGGGPSAELTLTVENPIPVITSATPSTLLAGQGDQALTLAGTGFINNTSVRAGGALVAATLSGGALSLTVPAALVASAGTLSVVAENPGPGGGPSVPLSLPVENPSPTAASLSPASTVVNGSSLRVNVAGAGFVAASAVQLDGVDMPTTFAAKDALSFTIPGARLEVGGTHAVTVTSPAPGGGTSASLTFTAENPAPTIASISPPSVAEGGAPFTLTVSGSGFNAASLVTLDGASVTTTLVGPTTLTAAIPTLALGPHDLRVTNPAPGGGSATSVLTATASAGPSITSLTPPTTEPGAAFSLTIGGANFRCVGASASVVLFGAAMFTPSSCSATELVVQVPAQAAGTYAVSVKNGNTPSNSLSFEVVAPNPVPSIGALSPARGLLGDADTVVTITGTGFVSGSAAKAGGAARATAFVSSTQLRVTLTQADLAAAGTVAVTVTNPAPGGGTSAAASFAVEHPAPTLASISPSTVDAGSGAVTITLTGTRFVAGAQALLDGSARNTAFVSSTQLTMGLTAADTATGRTATVTVRNPAPGGGTSAQGLTLTVASNPVPTLTSLAPASAFTGGAGFSLVVNGAGFVSGAKVSFNDVERATTFVSATQLSASIPASDVAIAGNYAVRVTNPAPGGGRSEPLTFTVTTSNPLPSITAASPSSLLAGSGAATIALSGTGFLSSSTYSVDGSAARAVTFTSSTQVSIALTAAETQSAGPRAIVVTNPAPGGGSSAAFNLTIVAPPTVSSLSPSSAIAGAATLSLSVTGTGFVQGSTVRFAGASRSTTFVSSTRLDATLGNTDLATAGLFDVSVLNPAPGGTSGNISFTVNNPAPTLASASPASVAAGSGAVTLTLTGTGFVSGSTAQVGGAGRTTRFVNTTQLAVDLTASDTASQGTLSLTVVNGAPGGGTSGAISFNVTAAPSPAPTISSLSPGGVVQGNAVPVLTINGSGFSAATTVTFNGTALTPTLVSATQLTVSVPASLVVAPVSITTRPSSAAVNVVVANPAPGGGSATATFGVATQAVTAAQVQTVISSRCAGCHGGFSTSSWKDRSAGSCPSSSYIKSFGPLPAQSYIVARVTAPGGGASACGSVNRMPPSGMSVAEQQLIIDWAAQGAP